MYHAASLKRAGSSQRAHRTQVCTSQGLVDAHVHLTPGGLALLHVELGGVRSKDAFIAAVKQAAGMRPEPPTSLLLQHMLNVLTRSLRQYCVCATSLPSGIFKSPPVPCAYMLQHQVLHFIAEAVPAGQWVVGGGWNEMLWGGEVPAAAWLDEAAPGNPVYLTRMDGHSAVVNSAALRAAGIDDATSDPGQGRILRDAAGAATGILACALADQCKSAHGQRHFPPPHHRCSQTEI